MGTLHHQDSVFQEILESGKRAQAGKAMMDLTEYLPPLLQEIKQEADQHPGVGIHGHAGEIELEAQAMIELTGLRNWVFLESISVVGPNVQMAHSVWLNEDEYRVMAETGSHALHCPCCNAKLGSGIARSPEMLDVGINVALGSDGAPSNNNSDMFVEMRTASLIHKYRLGAEALPAEDVLSMATRGGARALGMYSEIGSLEKGKLADLIILDDGGIAAAPMLSFEEDDIVKRLVSSYHSSSVQTSIISGKLVMENRPGRFMAQKKAGSPVDCLIKIYLNRKEKRTKWIQLSKVKQKK